MGSFVKVPDPVGMAQLLGYGGAAPPERTGPRPWKRMLTSPQGHPQPCCQAVPVVTVPMLSPQQPQGSGATFWTC